MNKTNVGTTILKVLMIIGIIGVIAFNVWAYVSYGNKPINEVPAWVLWFMFQR